MPAVFQIVQEQGRVTREEMYQVFNMGIGMVAIVAPDDAAPIARILYAQAISRVEKGRGKKPPFVAGHADPAGRRRAIQARATNQA